MRTLIILFSILVSFHLSANHVKKGFKELAASNYSYSLHHFQKALKKDKAVSAYGLTKLYLAPGMYNIDSSFKYIVLSEQSFAVLDSKKRLKIKEFQCDSLAIIELKMTISNLFYERLMKLPNLVSVNDFILTHAWSFRIPLAIDTRDSLAFSDALVENTSLGFQDYMANYPNSKLLKEAQVHFFDCQLKENTSSNKLEDLEAFLVNYPESPYREEVEDRIYNQYEMGNDLNDLTYFVRHFSTSRHAVNAWRKLFQLFMKDYSDQRLEEFKGLYADFPFMMELDNEIDLFKSTFYPYKNDGKYGFIQRNGDIVIEAKYDQVSPFREGLSIVLSGEFYGAIDKRNHLVIDAKFDDMEDFNLGKSIVEKDNVFGLVDRVGNFIFPLEYEDMGWLTDSLLYAKKNGLFGIYNSANVVQSELFFEDIIPFDGKLARVVKNGKVGFINRELSLVLQTEFDDLITYTDSSFIYTIADKMGLVHIKNNWKTNAVYDEIYPLHYGISMVRTKDKLGYIDAKGNLILALQFEQFPNFSKVGAFTKDGALIKKKGKYMLINEKGKITLPLPYESIGEWGEWMPVMKGFKWGFVNQKAKEMTLFEYDFVEKVSNSLFIVEKNGLSGLLTTNGSFVLPLVYKSIVQLGTNLLLVEDKNGFGVSTRDGQIRIPAMYSQIKYYEKDVLILYKDDGISFYFITTGSFVHPK